MKGHVLENGNASQFDAYSQVTPDRTECEHGGLKRKCEICQLTEELAAVTKDRDECAKLLAEIIDTQPVALVGRDWSKVKRVIRRSFPHYDPYVQPWPACLTGDKEDGR